MPKYRATLEVTTDRELTESERDLLAMTLYVMADEPVDEEGESAEWTATDVNIHLEQMEAADA